MSNRFELQNQYRKQNEYTNRFPNNLNLNSQLKMKHAAYIKCVVRHILETFECKSPRKAPSSVYISQYTMRRCCATVYYEFARIYI